MCYASFMNELINIFTIQFVALFFTIDVLGLVPIYISLTAAYSEKEKKAIVQKGVAIAFGILLFFTLLGASVLHIFGISIAAFRIAGGILLLLLAIGMVLDKTETVSESEKSEYSKSDISVFPLAMPLLSGPASISMLIIFMKQEQGIIAKQMVTIIALLINMIICYFVLVFATRISKILGKTGINILNRIFGILLTALACQFIITGITEAFNL